MAVDFSNSCLNECNFRNATLSMVDLRTADLDGIDLTGAKLEDVYINEKDIGLFHLSEEQREHVYILKDA